MKRLKNDEECALISLKKRIVLLVALAVWFTLISIPNIHASTKLLDWDFDNATFLDSECGDIGNDCGRILGYEPQLDMSRPSPQGGKYLRMRVYTNIWPDQNTVPTILTNDIPGADLKEFYVSYYYMLESDLTTGCGPNVSEVESVKQIRMDIDASFGSQSEDNALCVNHYPGVGQWHIYHPAVFSSGTCDSSPWEPGPPHDAPTWNWDKWVRLEVYIKFASTKTSCDGILRIWSTIEGGDRELDWEDTTCTFHDVDGEDFRSFGVIQHVKTAFSDCYDNYDQQGLDGHVRIDDIELWDGMPTAVYECSDLADNDLDGATDYPNDAGCSSSGDNDESNCGDVLCEGGETCSSCSADCGTCSCGPADTSGNGAIDTAELMSYISQWRAGLVAMTNLMSAIAEWKNGC